MRVFAAGIGLLFSSLLFMASSMGVVEILGAWREGRLPSYYQEHWEVFWSVLILNGAALVVLTLLGRSLWLRPGFALLPDASAASGGSTATAGPARGRFSPLKALGFGCFLVSYLAGYFIPRIL